MPTHPGLDALGNFNPVMDCGIEEIKIFSKDTEREDFFSQSGPQYQKGESGGGGGAVSGGNDIGGSPGGLFGGTA